MENASEVGFGVAIAGLFLAGGELFVASALGFFFGRSVGFEDAFGLLVEDIGEVAGRDVGGVG